MYSRWFNITVVVLWLATMSWLVRAKILPLLEIGDPPSIPEIVESQVDNPPVGWEILIDNRRIGWALTETKLQENGTRDIRGRVHFDKLPLGKIMPGWLKPLSKLVGQSVDDLRIDARSVLTVDALGNLLRFESTMRLDPPNEVIGMSGIMEGGQLRLVIRTGYASFTKEFRLPSKSLPSDFYSPQTALPGLYEGRTWTTPVYSPLWPSKNPLKIVSATVEGMEPIFWNGAMENVWVVVYRNSMGNASGGGRTQQGKMWVRRDGAVLRQQSRFSNSTITFVRMTERLASELVESAGKQWWTPESGAWMEYHD